MAIDVKSEGPRNLRIVLFSCAGAPFSAEILQAVQRERPEWVHHIAAAVLSLPKVSPLAALPLSQRWRKLYCEKGWQALAKEIRSAVGYRINGLWRRLERMIDARRRAYSPTATYRRIEEFCAAHAIPTHSTRDVNAEETLVLLRRLEPDVIVMATFNHILRRPAIEIAKLAILNIHPSMLPELRGPDPINEALRLKIRHTGVTLHLVDEGIDTGDILMQEPFTMPDGITEKGLRTQLADIAGVLLIKCLDNLRSEGRVHAQPQCLSTTPRREDHAT